MEAAVPADAYQPVSVPATIAPFSGVRWSADAVDYARHPAYRDLARGAGAKVAATARYAAKFALLLAKRVIRYEMIPYEFRSATSLKERAGFVGAGLRNALGFGKGKAAAAPRDAALDALGVAVATMPAARFAELESLAAPHFDALAKRRGPKVNRREFDESRATADRRQSPALFAQIETILAESGLGAAASAYMGREARLIDVNPQINDPSDSFWLDIFPDIEGKPLPRTAYFHRDASGGDLKAIIYMTDVGSSNGPFTYAAGSNHMAISRLDDLLCEANDHNGLSGTDPASRARFAALPAKLRQKGSFGNDLDDASPLSEAIGKAAWEIEAPKGSIVLFDTKGIHRGGMVEQGERRVITCVLG